MSAAPLRAVLFDFDFTLADSTAGAQECINHALLALGLPAASREKIRQMVAYPLPEILARLTGIEDPQTAAAFARAFITRADEVMAPLTGLFPTAIPAVRQLRERGLRTAIVSTKHRYRIQSILALHDAGSWFDAIIGGEDVQRHKPSPEPLERALSRLRLQACEVVYVGDHPVDAEAAEAASTPFIAVLTGASAAEDFASFRPLSMLNSLAELPPLLSAVFPAPPSAQNLKD